MLWTGAWLTAQSSNTRFYTERHRAKGVGCKLEPRVVSATNRSTALTKSIGSVAFPVLLTEQKLWPVP